MFMNTIRNNSINNNPISPQDKTYVNKSSSNNSNNVKKTESTT